MSSLNKKNLLFIVTENCRLKVTCSPQATECNKTGLSLEMEVCGGRFKTDMAHLDPQKWCNLTHFISEYHHLTSCTENSAVKFGCFWPHPVVEHYLILIHKQFFFNCTYIPIVNNDNIEDTLTLTTYLIIFVIVFISLIIVTSVMWCSKQR
ncbi:receptor activity-modifying protein 1 precursor [Silurus asotus]|uniref:Receptor activity-modifying protein 3 n=1 Tax=Silurus asotus TaxID=30991 RepID=A0AAD5AQ43_SILAS|nr:receptor activity-modifying protein 1 precursor [Silurus asotus]